MSPPPYVLIAISNVNRAAAFRSIAAEAWRMESVLVRDGEEAMQEIARHGSPGLLIVDLSLSRIDGFTVVRRLRRQDAGPHTRVVVVSAHESLRAAARELSTSLEISGILPLDADSTAMRDAIARGPDAQTSAAVPAAAPAHASRPTPTPDAEEVIDRAAVEIRRRFRMPVSIGYLRHGNVESLMFHVAARDADPPAGLTDLVDVAVLRQVAQSTEPLVVPDVTEHPVFARSQSDTANGVRGFAAVPVGIGREGAIAALCLIDFRPLTLSAADMDALMAIGRHAGLELDRAAMLPPERATPAAELPDDVKALQHMAATDPLTGIANRRGGERHIASEVSRAKRERRPLSCILIDLDRFKAVNDTFGHQAGDQLLRDISALLRRTVRAYDIVVRWGGEEFLVVLPGVGLDAARLLAERLRVAVEGLDTHGIGPTTVSAGVAEFSDEYDFAAVLREADRRMYRAKATGRNCVV